MSVSALPRPMVKSCPRASINDAHSAKSAPTNSNSAPAIAATPPAHDLPPALLVFRDGHTEEVRDYTIADGILYARGDFYTDGYWAGKKSTFPP